MPDLLSTVALARTADGVTISNLDGESDNLRLRPLHHTKTVGQQCDGVVHEQLLNTELVGSTGERNSLMIFSGHKRRRSAASFVFLQNLLSLRCSQPCLVHIRRDRTFATSSGVEDEDQNERASQC